MADSNFSAYHRWKHHLRPWNLIASALLLAIAFLLWTTFAGPKKDFDWVTRYLETIAAIAKYSGIVLTSALAIYGITHEFKDGPEGSKKLTRAGQRAVFVSVLLAVVTVLGTKMDVEIQAEKSEEARRKTKEELKLTYEQTKSDLENVYADQKTTLEKTYQQTTATLREQYEAGRLALEDSLKPVESVTTRTAFRFPESMRSQLPGDPRDWHSSGLYNCPASVFERSRCLLDWRGVSERFFHPMLSYDVTPKDRKNPDSKYDYFDDYGLLLSFILSHDPYVSLTVFPCAWKPSPYLGPGDAISQGGGVFKIVKVRCIPDAFFFLGRPPGAYIPNAPENPSMAEVGYSGDPRNLELTTEFRIDPETLVRFTKESTFKPQRRMVVGDFLSDASTSPKPIEVALLHYPNGVPPTEASSRTERLLVRLPLTITMQIWVNDDRRRIRKLVFTKKRDLSRIAKSWFDESEPKHEKLPVYDSKSLN